LLRIPREGLERSPLHSLVIDALERALEAADPYRAVKAKVRREGEELIVEGAGRFRISTVHVLGFGKAAALMAKAVLDALNGMVEGGVIIVPRGSKYPELKPLKVLEADHPIPTERTLRASRELVNYAQSIPRDSLALVLVSGGGSALFEIPANGISIEDVAWVTRQLLTRGASIEELNAVRKHISLVKGGMLLKHIGANSVVTLVLSDVVGDRLDTIASGPTVPDTTTFHDAYSVLRKYGLWNSLPDPVRRWIEKGLRGEVPDTPKPNDPIFTRSRVVIVANNLGALKAAKSYLESKGYNTLILTDRLRGEAREVAKSLAAVIESIAYNNEPVPPPAAILAGGETTVTVRGKGKGGRNQELCLALSITINSRVDYVAACMGTDGIDGNSPAAGAIVDNLVLTEAERAGLNPEAYLEENDSYTFFSKLRRAIITGYTGTNVNDVFIALVQPLKREDQLSYANHSVS
jgi:glycerate 2-kinase